MIYKKVLPVTGILLAFAVLFFACNKKIMDAGKTADIRLDSTLLKKIIADPDLAKFVMVTDSGYINQYRVASANTADTLFSAEEMRREFAPYQLAIQYAVKIQERYKLTNAISYIKAAAAQYVSEKGSPYANARIWLAKGKQVAGGTTPRSVEGAISGTIFDPVTGTIYVTDNPDYGGFYIMQDGGFIPCYDPVYNTLAEVVVTGSYANCIQAAKMKLYYIATLYPAGLASYMHGTSPTNFCPNCYPNPNLSFLSVDPGVLTELYNYVLESYLYSPHALTCDQSWLGKFEGTIITLDALTSYKSGAEYTTSGGGYGGSGGSSGSPPPSSTPFMQQTPSLRWNYLNDLLRQLQQEEEQEALAPCKGTIRLGNYRFSGTLEHWLIQQQYLLNRPAAYREFQVYNGSTYSYVDIADPTTFELYEIKPVWNQGSGAFEVSSYASWARQYCNPQWHAGTDFQEMKIPFTLADGKPGRLIATLDSKNPGLVLYRYEDQQIPRPIVLPQSVVERLKDWIRNVAQSSYSSYKDIDIAITYFLAENPEMVTYIKGLAIGIAVATIVEDILTLGTGIADDAFCFYIANRMWQIASKVAY